MLVNNQSDSKKNVLICANAAIGKKAQDLVIMKVKELSSFTDYFILCSGTSDRHVQAITDFIEEKMKKSGILPLGIEGRSSAKWVLMDYGDIIVHIFFEPVREFYEIERLWADAPAMAVEDTVQELVSLDDNF